MKTNFKKLVLLCSLCLYSYAYGQITGATQTIREDDYEIRVDSKDTLKIYPPQINPLTPESKRAIKTSTENAPVLQSVASISMSNLSHIPTTYTIDKTKEVGEIPVQCSQGQNGALAYSIPVELYPGRDNFTPGVSISYNSFAGNGVAGMGWDIGGASMISFTNSSIYFDGKTEAVRFNKNGALVLDGMRLINLNTGTTTESYYQSETGNIKATAYLSGDIIKYFKVYYPNGSVAVFGYSNNTSAKPAFPITEMTDNKDNYFSYSYNQIDNKYYLSEINYGGKKNPVFSHFARVAFDYETRSDIVKGFTGGQEMQQTRRLKEIKTYFGSTLLRTYRPTYEQQLGVSLLKQLDCISEGKSLNPLIFYYGEGNPTVGFNKFETLLTTYFSNPSASNMILRKGKFSLYDVKDGLIVYPNFSTYDIVTIKNNQYYQMGSKYSASQSLLFYGDINP